MTRRTRTLLTAYAIILVTLGIAMFVYHGVMAYALGFGAYLGLDMVLGGRRVDHDLEIERLEAECFALSAGVCPHLKGNDHGNAYCGKTNELI